MMPKLYAFLAVALVSIISLTGILFIALKELTRKRILLFLVSFSAGSLLGGAFFHLIPEANEKFEHSHWVAVLVLVGILVFFAVEKFLRWRHCHVLTSCEHPHPLGVMNLIGDGVHNFIDGLIIGASFLVDTKLGLTTTLAVILHEIPQEIGDFSVLLYASYTIKKALWYNFLSALTAVLGTMVSLVVGSLVYDYSYYLMPIAAGGFIYIAGTDLIPELHHEISFKKSLVQFLFLFLGMGLLFLLRIIFH
jgi:zinc and cadmium transporter